MMTELLLKTARRLPWPVVALLLFVPACTDDATDASTDASTGTADEDTPFETSDTGDEDPRNSDNGDTSSTVGQDTGPSADTETSPETDSATEEDTRPFDHIIITSSEMRDATTDYTLHDLAAHRSRNGHRSMIVVVSDIYAKYEGRDNPEKIRNFIIDARGIWGTRFFLIAGKDSIVPVRDLYVWDGAIASDFYYAALDGDFNADGNEQWGKYPEDAPDVTPDVHVGRIPAKDAEQISNFVYKVITYENSPVDSSYHSKSVLWTTPDVGQFPLRGTHPDWDQIHNAPNTTVEQRNNIDTHPFVFQRMSSGNYGLFIGGGHGWENLSCQLTSDDVDRLANRDRYFLYTSISCFSGKFREDRSFNERLVVGSRDGGAYATMLNSETGIPPQTCWLQDAMMNTHFTNGKNTLGEILNDVRVQTTTRPGWYTFDDAITRHAIYAYNLFGDPATPFRMNSAAAENAQFTFDESSGSQIFDAHGTMASGKLSGDATRANNAIMFSSGGCIEVPDSPWAPLGNQAEFGAMAWIQRNTTGGTMTVISKGQSARSFTLAIAADGRLRLDVNAGGVVNGVNGGTWWSAALVPEGQRTHVAVTYNDWTKTVEFFINGKKDNSAAADLYLGHTSEPLFIGCDPSGTFSGFNGFIDDVRIWSSSINEADIAAVRN